MERAPRALPLGLIRFFAGRRLAWLEKKLVKGGGQECPPHTVLAEGGRDAHPTVGRTPALPGRRRCEGQRLFTIFSICATWFRSCPAIIFTIWSTVSFPRSWC